MAVEFAFQARRKPESIEMKDCPDFVFGSVTRKMREPKVGSVMTEFAGPRAGAGGFGRTFVSVMALYVDGATCASEMTALKNIAKELIMIALVNRAGQLRSFFILIQMDLVTSGQTHLEQWFCGVDYPLRMAIRY
jgi:hypothetical protein